ncbi:hypothetical protein [Liquorilactobacillus mali]|uniref:hypothetical protein n=1 Tax=Liquorilactobacillus mali TaxID=1618 RepID=UPI000249144A|nr:hypothetical protein [Liquorilactobacillus mali]EJE98229.1 hypothetical protein LMA_08138 [Liquorilactobacillus mali KCTC 3596 = DSM 20444]MDC7953572.1 hypothetical protein [Liquorilactobacillus mali]QFQ75002.1 hypothetical protein LM596_07660 [Liquorilactobacillus mali]
MKERRAENDWNDIRGFVQNFMVDVSFRNFRAVFIGVGQLVCQIKKESTWNRLLTKNTYGKYNTKERKYE